VTLNHRPTVVLADDHIGILKRVSGFLAEEFNIVATVSDGIKAIQAAEKLRPDILVLDIGMPGIDGINAAREIKRLGIVSKLIFLTVQEDDDYIRTARAIGACYVVKCRMHVDLRSAIQEALAGRIFCSPLSSVVSPNKPT
jgi:DNA-binding NarL/FixJ family response regulator